MNHNKYFADLHIHTTASDGVLNPEDVVEMALGKGLSAIAITDHDTVSGIEAAKKQALNTPLKVVPGVELSCGWVGRESSIHVLGLFVDYKSKCLVELLEKQRLNRYSRAFKMLEKLENVGIDMSALRERFEKEPEKVHGRPHVGRYLVDAGHVKDLQHAFELFLGKNRPAYVKKSAVPVPEAIETIHAAGGIALLAHPGLIPDWDHVWDKVGHLDWDGFETYYPKHSPGQVSYFEDIVQCRNWLSSGGSDFHGDSGKHNAEMGCCGLKYEQYYLLLERLNKKLGMNPGFIWSFLDCLNRREKPA